MRLLLVTNDYPPKSGGIQTYLRDFVDAYPDEVLVYAPADDQATDEGESVVRGDRTYMLPTSKLAERIIEAARPFAPDVILFGAPHPLPTLGPKLRSALGVPYGILSHGAEVTIPGAVPVSRQLLGRTFRDADVRFAVSRYTAQKVERIAGRPATFVGAGVDTSVFVPAGEAPNNPRPVIGCVSRFVPRKGQHRLLQAVSQLEEDVEVLMVGRGRTENQLRKLADRLGVRVRFEIDVPWSALPSMYQQMDVFCMPTKSRWGGLEVEGLGLVFLEAAASGLPVLAGISGGSPETVLPAVTGFVVSNVDDIVEGLEILLADPPLARRMGVAGRQFVESEFTWERVVERFQNGFAAQMR